MPYGKPIRILHALLAVSVLIQIAIGELMDVPGEGEQPGHAFLQMPLAFAHEGHAGVVTEETLGFEVHEYLGLFIVALIVMRLILAFTTVPGGAWRSLFPYLSNAGRKTLIEESKAQFAGWKQARLAPPEEGETVARSVHGLIILSIVLMSITGVVLYFGWNEHGHQTALIDLFGETHEVVVGVLEGLLGAHVLAVILHYRQGHNLLARIKPGGE